MAEETPIVAKTNFMRSRRFYRITMLVVICNIPVFVWLVSLKKPPVEIQIAEITIDMIIIGALAVTLWNHFKRERGLFCPNCRKFIELDAIWRCAFCDQENEVNPVLFRCEKCHKEPESCVCSHCGGVILLTSDGDSLRPAEIVIKKNEDESSEDARAKKREDHLAKKEQLECDIEITRLAAQLEELKASSIFKQQVSEREDALSKRFNQFEKHTMGVRMLAKKKRQEYEMAYKNDPDLLEQLNEGLDSFIEQEAINGPKE